MGIRLFLQYRSLKRIASKNKRQKKMRNLSEMKYAFVLVSIKSLNDYSKWENIFNNLSINGLNVDWIAFVSHLEEKQEINIPKNILTKKDYNFIGVPKLDGRFKRILSKNYDLTLDLNFDDVYLLNYFWVQLKSNLRVGSDIKEKMSPFYDMTFKTKDPYKQPKLFIDQVFYFLDKINK